MQIVLCHWKANFLRLEFNRLLLLIFSVTMEFSTTHNYYEVNILNDSFDSFDSDFCKVQRIAEAGVVLLTWKNTRTTMITVSRRFSR